MKTTFDSKNKKQEPFSLKNGQEQVCENWSTLFDFIYEKKKKGKTKKKIIPSKKLYHQNSRWNDS